MPYPNDQGNPAGAIPVYMAPAQANPLTQAPINFATSGNNTIVAAVAGKVVKVYRMTLTVGGATNITLYNGATALTGPIPLATNGSYVLDFSGIPWYTTTASNAFIINSSAAVQVSGALDYTQA